MGEFVTLDKSVSESSKYYQKKKLEDPEYNKRALKRQRELHPDFCKIRNERQRRYRNKMLLKDPDYYSKQYRKQVELHPNMRKERYEIQVKDNRIKLCILLEGQVKCRRCNITDIGLIDFDHINGDGKEDRNRFNGGREGLVKYYASHPNEAMIKLQPLCRNCHRLKTLESKEYVHRSKLSINDDKQLTLFSSAM